MVLQGTCIGSDITAAIATLSIKPISRISPSKFHLFRECKLRGLLESNRVQRLLPLSPSAHCGTVIHRIIEKASRGEIKSPEDFEKTWNDCIEDEENNMKMSWIESHLVPLAKSTQRYDLKKYQCFLSVKSMVEKSESCGSGTFPRKGEAHEAWLEDQHGTAGGYVDAIFPTEVGDIIADYKTGAIAGPREEGWGSSISEKYKIQLKLYAAIYNSLYSIWPISLQIIGINGATYEVDFEQEECIRLLDEAKKIKSSINSMMESELDRELFLKKLSSPSPQNCIFCSYRPACSPYWEKRESDQKMNWPKDTRGFVKEKKVLGNGKILVRLIREGDSDPISIRGLHPQRHPALNIHTDSIAVFSMKSDRIQNRYKEGLLTTIYAAR